MSRIHELPDITTGRSNPHEIPKSLVEEQLFRGYVLVRLTERLSLAVAIPSMLVGFSLLHFGLGWTGMLVATLTGALLTGLFVWRRSLVPVIVAHALVNTLVLTL